MATGPSQPPIKLVPLEHVPRKKALGRNMTLTSSSETNNEPGCTSTTSLVFMTRTGRIILVLLLIYLLTRLQTFKYSNYLIFIVVSRLK